MKIIQISDLHFCSKNLTESERCCSAVLDQAETIKPDLIVISGDTTEHRLDVHSAPYRSLAAIVQRASTIAPILLLQGTFSHEPRGTIEALAMLSIKHPILPVSRLSQVGLTHEGRFVQSTEAMFQCAEVNQYKALLTCVPTLNVANVAAQVGPEKVRVEAQAAVRSYLLDASVVNSHANRLGIPTIGVSHGTIYGCVTEHNTALLTLDNEYALDDLFGAHCKAFMLGHIHAFQTWWREDQVIGYGGSVGRYHHGDTSTKGGVLWTISSNDTRVDQVLTPASLMIKHEFEGIPDEEALHELATQARCALVSIKIRIDQEAIAFLNKRHIEEIFCDAAELKLSVVPYVVQRSRSEGIGQALSVKEKLAIWATSSHSSLDEIAPLLDQIMTMETAEIMESIEQLYWSQHDQKISCE